MAQERIACPHTGTGTLFNREKRIAFKADCGRRAHCAQARRRWRLEMRERLALVEYLRPPDLWTLTTRTQEQDALLVAVRLIAERRRRGQPVMETAERLARFCMWRARDRGAVTRENIAIMKRGRERLTRFAHRQAERQQEAGYERSVHAARLRRKWGTHWMVRGRPGAAFRIRVDEAGELHGRLHSHVASDFAFLHHGWLDAAALRCGLGHVQFEQSATNKLHVLARMTTPEHRGRSIAAYLSKYLSSTPDDAPWPWPKRARLVSAARGQLPPRPPKPGWCFTPKSVALVAVDGLGARCIDVAATFYAARDDPDAAPALPPGA